MIHVVYRLWGGDGFYAKLLATSMLSMFENTKEKLIVHIMHNERLTPDNRNKFCYIANRYNQQIEFHNVEEISGVSLGRIEEAHPNKSGVNAYWYTFILHEVFPDLDKLIFLGADTVINLDIGELWEYDLDESCGIAAVPEILSGAPPIWFKLVIEGYVKHENHINSDVLLVNPKFFMKNFERLLEGCRFVYEQGCIYVEQDVLDYLYSEDILKLPRKFNALVIYLRNNPKNSIGKEIYHFGGAKPDLNTDDIYNRLYFEYFLKTPYANVDMFGNLDKAFMKQYDRFKMEFLHYTNLLALRERVFLIDKAYLEQIRRILVIKDDELLIDASDFPATKKFLDTTSELKGKKLI